MNEAPTYYDVQQHQINNGVRGGGGGGGVMSSNSGLPGYSPQRRFLSESELVRQGIDHSYARANNTVDNIRELAGSPQRGVYMWKDSSPNSYTTSNAITANSMASVHQHQPTAQRPPPYDYYRSNPTSPTQQTITYTPQRPPYHPANRGGVPVFPPQPSPQVKRKANAAAATAAVATMATPTTPTSNDARRRPMSFVRALEMTDSIDMASPPQQQHQQNDGRSNSSQNPTTPTPDRASVYDMNYEISV